MSRSTGSAIHFSIAVLVLDLKVAETCQHTMIREVAFVRSLFRVFEPLAGKEMEFRDELMRVAAV